MGNFIFLASAMFFRNAIVEQRDTVTAQLMGACHGTSNVLSQRDYVSKPRVVANAATLGKLFRQAYPKGVASIPVVPSLQNVRFEA